MNSKVLLYTGGALIFLSGVLVLIAGWFGVTQGGLLGVLIGITVWGIAAAQIITGAVIIFAGTQYQRHKKWSIIALVSGIMALFSGGGFFVGALLAIMGALTGLAEPSKRNHSDRNARKKTPKRRRR